MTDYDWKNPMRFSISYSDVNIDEFGVHVTEIDIRPAEGNIYVHWEEEDA